MVTTGDVVFFEYVKGSKKDNLENLIYVWDIDKTYLDTQFETIRGLLRTAFEKAFQKKNVPGTATLIKALGSSLVGTQSLPIYFISASPPQMESKLHQKMLIDQINPWGIFFKDNLKNV